MSIRLLICVWIAVIVQAQNPCRVNVIFSLEASQYVKSEGESIIYDQISRVQSTYQNWTISPNSVRATLPKPIGCTQGGNWNLQNDANSLNNVVTNVKKFLYTCFQQNSLSDYITSLNNQILQSQTVDPANYVFVIFTATTNVSDVQQAINLRTQFFDPKGYGLIVVTVEPIIAANLVQLATYGIYGLGDAFFTQDITSAVCNGGSQPQSTTEINTFPPYSTEIPFSTEIPMSSITPTSYNTDYYDLSTVSDSAYDIDDDIQEMEKKIHELRAHRQAQKQNPKQRKINHKNLTDKVSHKKVAAKKQDNKIVNHPKLQTHAKTRPEQNKTMVKNLPNKPIVKNLQNKPMMKNLPSKPMVKNVQKKPMVKNLQNKHMVKNLHNKPMAKNLQDKHMMKNLHNKPMVKNLQNKHMVKNLHRKV